MTPELRTAIKRATDERGATTYQSGWLTVPTMSTPKPWVQCERCRQMFPPGQLYTCGPGGRWLYCGRCMDIAAKHVQPTGDR